MTLRPVTADHERVVDRLDAAGLPSDDVADGPARLYIATVDDEPVGIGGLEAYGRVGLLRSVVVDGPHRGEGLGAQLVRALEDEAAERGVEELFLLTTTAAGFFERLGYERHDRRSVPASIASTTEFADACPDSAACLRRRLGRD